MNAQREGAQVSVVCAAEDVVPLATELSGTGARIGTSEPAGVHVLRSCEIPFDRGAFLRSLYKPTDNALARLNRRVSIPISVRLVETPLSPNAISLIGLFLSLVAGLAYARGGYAWMLAGAFISWFSSMWDGCDGEVARMTFRESDFGCWLDSVCDDLYYGFVFIGMTVGLARSGHGRFALDLGAVSLVGMIVMVAVHYVLRSRVAARTGNATSFARFFEERMQALGDDPFARFGRATYKLGTRSTLPYVLFTLAIVGQSWVALVIVAVGPHVYWTLSLYLWWAQPRAAPVRPRPRWLRPSSEPPPE